MLFVPLRVKKALSVPLKKECGLKKVHTGAFVVPLGVVCVAVFSVSFPPHPLPPVPLFALAPCVRATSPRLSV